MSSAGATLHTRSSWQSSFRRTSWPTLRHGDPRRVVVQIRESATTGLGQCRCHRAACMAGIILDEMSQADLMRRPRKSGIRRHRHRL